MKDTTIRKARRIWLWVLFLVNMAATIGDISGLFSNIGYLEPLTIELFFFVGVCLLLFANQKRGFWILCVITVVRAAYNLYSLFIIRNELMKFQIIMSVSESLFSFVVPAITYLLLLNDWENLE
jgi:hypothetical protein